MAQTDSAAQLASPPRGLAAAPGHGLPDGSQSELFDLPPRLPHGLVYRPQFLSAAEEAALLAEIAPLPFREARFQQYVARRRVVHFHADDAADVLAYDDGESFSSGPAPPFLVALQQRIAMTFGMARTAFVHTLVSEYPPGAPIGWHRDKPAYGVVFGLSLKGRGRMRFRPLEARADPKQAFVLDLEPRSLYVMQGPIRWLWQHSLLPARELRYSITLRTRARDEPAVGG
jgi:alkylated DNA repair dioxygenase AlkB